MREEEKVAGEKKKKKNRGKRLPGTTYPLVTAGKAPGAHDDLETDKNDLIFISFKIKRKKSDRIIMNPVWIIFIFILTQL